MSATLLNPTASPTAGTPSAAQSDVSSGYSWYYRIGKLVVATANFRDPTPVNNSVILAGYPAPASRVPMPCVCGTDARRLYLSTDGKLYWDGSTSTNWANAVFSYVTA